MLKKYINRSPTAALVIQEHLLKDMNGPNSKRNSADKSLLISSKTITSQEI